MHTHTIYTLFCTNSQFFHFLSRLKSILICQKKKHHGVSIWRKLMLSNMTHKGLLNLSIPLVRTSCMLLKLTWYCWLYNCNIHLICLSTKLVLGQTLPAHVIIILTFFLLVRSLCSSNLTVSLFWHSPMVLRASRAEPEQPCRRSSAPRAACR